MYPEPDKLGKQFKYAAARGRPKVVAVLGATSVRTVVVTIKDMKTGQQSRSPASNCRETRLATSDLRLATATSDSD